MNELSNNRIMELFDEGKSSREVARIMLEEFPNESISLEGWKSRANRLRLKLKEPCIKPLNNKPEVKSNIKVESPCSVEYKSGSTTFEKIISLTEGELITPEIMLNAHNLDINMWDVVSYKNNYWSQQGTENAVVVLYQSKITVKPKNKNELSLKELIQYFNDNCVNNISCIPKTFNIPKPSGRLLEINITDLHLGKLCWSEETGDTYDLDIAKDRFFKLVGMDLKRIMSGEFEKVLFVWCNDFFNFEGMSNATTKGTPQSVSGQWQQLFQLGCKMLVDAIQLISNYCEIETFYIASNHARQSEFYAINYLNAWFRNNKNVIVHVNSSPRYYIKWGINLIGFAHSSYEKKQNLTDLMSTERPQYWATTKYREFHLAHYHCEEVKEKGGVIYRWLPSVTSTDSWHNDCGYIGANKRCYSFVYDKNYGLVQINNNMIQLEEITDEQT